MTECTYTVYRHTCPNGKIYVGVTVQDPIRRWANGFGYRNNRHFFAAIEKYGWDNIRHEILADGLTKNQAEALEIQLIADHNSTDPRNGYNHSTGGRCNSGVRMTEESKKKISHAKMGHSVSTETREKLRNAQTGKTLSDETRQKMSDSRKKRMHEHPELLQRLLSAPREYKPITEETRERLSIARKLRGPVSAETKQKTSASVRAYKARQVLCVETQEIFATITDAARAKGIRDSHICEVCTGRRKTAGGLHWNYSAVVQ